MPLDVSPATEAADNNDTSSVSLNNPGDGYGSSTIAFGTEIARVCPPKAKHFTRITGWHYNCSTTSHSLTVMVPLMQSTVDTDAAAGQAVIKTTAILTDLIGNAAGAGDFIVVKDEENIFGVYKIASVSGLSYTITVSVGSAGASGFVYKVPAGRVVWMMGTPGTGGDHTSRVFAMPVSTITPFFPASGISTTQSVGQPIVLHSNNAAATGVLTGPFYENVKIKA